MSPIFIGFVSNFWWITLQKIVTILWPKQIVVFHMYFDLLHGSWRSEAKLPPKWVHGFCVNFQKKANVAWVDIWLGAIDGMEERLECESEAGCSCHGYDME